MRVTHDIDRIARYYPTIHLFGRIYLVRRYSRKAKKVSMWSFVKYEARGKE